MPETPYDRFRRLLSAEPLTEAQLAATLGQTIIAFAQVNGADAVRGFLLVMASSDEFWAGVEAGVTQALALVEAQLRPAS